MPQFIDNFAQKIAKYSAGMANKLLIASENISQRFGYERKIVIGKHKVYVRYKNQGHTGKYSGNSDFYANGEIYIKGCANPIRIDPEEWKENENVDLVSSQKYRQAIKNRIVSQALNTPSNEYTLAEKLLMALVGIAVMGLGAGVFVMM